MGYGCYVGTTREEDSRLPYTFVMSDDPEWAMKVFRNHHRLQVASVGDRPPNTEWEFSRQFCDRVLLTGKVFFGCIIPFMPS
ncbi:hypothetical protein KIN20_009607 [Parelaphostrongylus tenuis]|uniref:Uncharacterized protein n=1 Tax=Parelaphostrongylus tenuis TaxID=148309 RepID=A0AAD5MQT9_PARTN|nr:hypothetical protein KIN20_009607 [Parelaphostrongylus tenuis]